MIFINYKFIGKYINAFSAFIILLFLALGQVIVRISLPNFYSNFLGNPLIKLVLFGLAIIFSIRFFKLKSNVYFNQVEKQIPHFPFFIILFGLFLLTKIFMELEIMAKSESNEYLLSFNKQFGLSKINLIFTLLLVTPIVEEILFRKIFLKNFVQLYSIKKAIIFSSILFAITHLSSEAPFTSLLYSFFLGLVLAVVIQISNNLKLVIGLHIFWNVLNFLFPLLFAFFSFQASNLVTVYTYLIVLTIISFLSIYASVVLIKKNNHLKNTLTGILA